MTNEQNERYQRWYDRISTQTSLDYIEDQFEIDDFVMKICNASDDKLDGRTWDQIPEVDAPPVVVQGALF